MISPEMRTLLLLGSLSTIAFMLSRIRASQILIRDAIYWLLFSLLLFFLSLFPEVTVWASQMLGIIAPINFVYLFVIFLLVIKLFSSSIRLSQLDTRLQQLAQRVALNDKKNEDESSEEK